MMMRIFGIVLRLVAMHVKARLAYRLDFLAELAASVGGAALSVGFVWLLFEHPLVNDIQGWTREQVLFIYGLSLVPTGLFHLIAMNIYQFGNRYVIEGQLDRVLLRPLPGLVQILSESFSLPAAGEALSGLALMAYCSAKLGLVWTAVDLAAFAVMAVSGAAIFLGVFVCLACVNFWAEDRIGVAPPFYNMIAFGRYPITLYRPWLRIVLSWIVPFAFIGFYPATGFLLEGEAFEPWRLYWMATPAVGLTVLLLAAVVWSLGVRRYASTGS